MLSRLVLHSRNVLMTQRCQFLRPIARSVSSHPQDEILDSAPPLPLIKDSSDPESRAYDPKKESLEDFLNIRFGENFPTLADEKSPQRDVKNFPRVGAPIMPDRTRLFILPDSWFQYFYDKTGVTGPYVFGVGFWTFLLSKEFYVLDHEFPIGVSLAILTAASCYMFGGKYRQWYCSLQDAEAESWDIWQKGMVNFLQDLINGEKKSQEMAKNQSILFDAKRENVSLQLEAEFRRRQMHVYNEVRNRLEYMLAKQVAERQYQQNHMVNWIINNVAKSIGAQQEKDVLQKCLSDLKQLSANHKISLT